MKMQPIRGNQECATWGRVGGFYTVMLANPEIKPSNEFVVTGPNDLYEDIIKPRTAVET